MICIFDADSTLILYMSVSIQTYDNLCVYHTLHTNTKEVMLANEINHMNHLNEKDVLETLFLNTFENNIYLLVLAKSSFIFPL